jgi:hypothetical protein
VTIPAACDFLVRPQYAYRGKTIVDQIWIDQTIEAEVSGCKWPRPQAAPSAKGKKK